MRAATPQYPRCALRPKIFHNFIRQSAYRLIAPIRIAPFAFAVAALLLLPALVSAQSSAPLRLEKSIPLPGVKGRIDHMAIDLAGKRIFVSALGNNTIEVVNFDSGKVLKTITGLSEPQGVLYQPQTQRLWVDNGGDGTVRIFDARNYRLLRKINLGSDADNIRHDPSSHRILVGYGSGGIAIFDENGNKVANIKLSVHPESFQLQAHGPLLFVNLPRAHQLDVINRARLAILARWRTDDALGNFPMALDEKDHRLFSVCRDPAVLLVFDTHSGAVIAKLPTVAVADDVYYDHARKRIYVTGGGGVVDVYQQKDSEHYARIAQVHTAIGARTSLFVPRLNLLFVAGRREGSKPAEIRIFKAM